MILFPQTKQYSSSITLLILLTVIGGIVWYGMRPLKQAIDEKRRAIQEFYASKENRERQVGQLPEFENQYESIVAHESMLDILIPEARAVDFVKILEGLAQAADVTMSITSKDGGKIVEKEINSKRKTRTKEGDTDDKKGNEVSTAAPIVETLPLDRYLSLSVKAEGQYSNIANFLNKMEMLPYGLDVISVDIKRKEDKVSVRSAAARDNPFVVSAVNPDGTPAAVPIVEKNVLEAVFDLVVYVKK